MNPLEQLLRISNAKTSMDLLPCMLKHLPVSPAPSLHHLDLLFVYLNCRCLAVYYNDDDCLDLLDSRSCSLMPVQ